MKIPHMRYLAALFIAIGCFALPSTAQQKPASPQEVAEDDVLKVDTSLIQTDVMVFDKHGQFVDGLKKDQFILKVDGKVQPVEFFDRVVAGSVDEDAQLAAARGQNRASASGSDIPVTTRGRSIIFFIDDFHMAQDSVLRTQKAIRHYIDNELGQNDQAAVVSASGNIGFLQQLTDEREVLSRAVSKLSYSPYNVKDIEHPVMSEYQALLISQHDSDTTNYFVDAYISDNPGTRRDSAEQYIDSRAQLMLAQAAVITQRTLGSTLSLLHVMQGVPGRKLLFLFSDGFLLDNQSSSMVDKIRHITDVSRRANTVIYSVDARGLAVGLPTAADEVAFDITHRLDRSVYGALSASQDAMNALAVDTGGKAFRNNNDLKADITESINETRVYYLLAWKPLEQGQDSAKFKKIELTVPDRPDLKVRVRQGFFTEIDGAKPKRGKTTSASQSTKASPTPVAALKGALFSTVPRTQIPLTLSAIYIDVPAKGAEIAGNIEIDSRYLKFEPSGTKRASDLHIAGIVLNDEGKQMAGFLENVKVTLNSANEQEKPNRGFAYGFREGVKPGLYQVRVAVWESGDDRSGSATQWVVVRDLADHKLALSGLFIGDKPEALKEPVSAGGTGTKVSEAPQISVTRKFPRSSRMRFLTFIYNAEKGTATPDPDIVLQVQVFRDNQPVITAPLIRVPTEGLTDMSRIPYAAELSLEGIPPGKCVLHVTAIDRKSKTSSVQHAEFTII